MAGERTYPVLAVPDLDDALALYTALGFTVTMQQRRPNPYAVVRREDLAIHLSGVDGLDPAASLGNVIVVVPDAAALHGAFAAGLRSHYGRIPATGAPRLLRPRKKRGTVTGFSLVDTGGNWLRVYGADEPGEDEAAPTAGLLGKLEAAARLGDAKDDPVTALTILEKALVKHGDARPVDRARALLYVAELAVRTADPSRARTALDEVRALSLSASDEALLADEFAATVELVDQSP